MIMPLAEESGSVHCCPRVSAEAMSLSEENADPGRVEMEASPRMQAQSPLHQGDDDDDVQDPVLDQPQVSPPQSVLQSDEDASEGTTEPINHQAETMDQQPTNLVHSPSEHQQCDDGFEVEATSEDGASDAAVEQFLLLCGKEGDGKTPGLYTPLPLFVNPDACPSCRAVLEESACCRSVGKYG